MTTYLVTGATGAIGSLVVEQLIKRGDRPRVFVRDADRARSIYGSSVDVFVGDLGEVATLKPALRGADTLLLVNAGPDLAARDEAAAYAAKAEGVNHLVKLSSYDAEQNVGTGVWHAEGEKAIRASGIPFTFVQPSGFMSNALFWAASIKAEGIVRSATGEGKIPFIHPQDIADVATRALTSHEYDGISLPVTGPEALSYAEMAGKVGAAIGKALTFVPISEEQVQRQMIDSNDPAEIVAAHLSIYRAIREGRLAAVTDAVEQVLRRKAFTFDRWVQENAESFDNSGHTYLPGPPLS
jgi:uncharacterized protein YbjT (DUF2867 family)